MHLKGLCVLSLLAFSLQFDGFSMAAQTTEQKKEEAYATLVTTDDFVMGAAVLAHTIRGTGSNKPMICLTTPGLKDSTLHILHFAGYKLYPVSDLNCVPPDPYLNYGVFRTNCAKFHLWGQFNYSKLVYLDADTMLLQNIDDLFDRPGFAAAPELLPPDNFNAGVMVIEPSAAVYNDLLELVKKPSWDGSDQGHLNLYFDWWRMSAEHRMPATYNILQFYTTYPPAWAKLVDRGLKVIHFNGGPRRKPWHPDPEMDAQMSQFFSLWVDYQNVVASRINLTGDGLNPDLHEKLAKALERIGYTGEAEFFLENSRKLRAGLPL